MPPSSEPNPEYSHPAPFTIRGNEILDGYGVIVLSVPIGGNIGSMVCAMLNNAAEHKGVFMSGVLAERCRIARLLAVNADELDIEVKGGIGGPAMVATRSRLAWQAREYAHTLDPFTHPSPK